MFVQDDGRNARSGWACRPAADLVTIDRSARYATDLLVDGWLVEPMLNLLTRDGVSVPLRAQLMDLLLCLASRPGKVFRKEELMQDVWEGRYVADSALSRCIAELRAAIGDNAGRPRVIQTITKRGYRMIAPVEILAWSPASPSVPLGLVVEDAVDDRRPLNPCGAERLGRPHGGRQGHDQQDPRSEAPACPARHAAIWPGGAE